jgi:hydrogenase maturation factor
MRRVNLIYAEIVDVFAESGMRMGKIRIGGAMKNVALELITNVQRGDVVLLCDGVAISKVQEEASHVSRDSR